MTIKLRSIEEEAQACRERWKGKPVGTIAAHCHHRTAFEVLTENAENRISYILRAKPVHEQALRLRLFAPIDERLLPDNSHVARKKAYIAWKKAYAKWQKADAAWTTRFHSHTEWQTQRLKVYTEWQKADTELKRAEDEHLKKTVDSFPHVLICPAGEACPWNGKTIFA